jgi:hypothetical protein
VSVAWPRVSPNAFKCVFNGPLLVQAPHYGYPFGLIRHFSALDAKGGAGRRPDLAMARLPMLTLKSKQRFPISI